MQDRFRAEQAGTAHVRTGIAPGDERAPIDVDAIAGLWKFYVLLAVHNITRDPLPPLRHWLRHWLQHWLRH